jgi:hypothetical protein
VKEAMKVNTPRVCQINLSKPDGNTFLGPYADFAFLVLLVDTVILHAHERFQQDGIRSIVLPCLSHEALPPGLPGTGCHIGGLDDLFPFYMHFPMRPTTQGLRSIDPRDVHQLCVTPVSTLDLLS